MTKFIIFVTFICVILELVIGFLLEKEGKEVNALYCLLRAIALELLLNMLIVLEVANGG